MFLDISMQMDGTETLRLIQEINADIQVIVVSGYASEELARDLLKQGLLIFFQKPVDLMRLQEAVEPFVPCKTCDRNRVNRGLDHNPLWYRQ